GQINAAAHRRANARYDFIVKVSAGDDHVAQSSAINLPCPACLMVRSPAPAAIPGSSSMVESASLLAAAY
ncbi:MAG: hypothetical protein WCF44_16180, partial [Candidatus Methylophosphatis roskildensis]